jgi:hypothetical protein
MKTAIEIVKKEFRNIDRRCYKIISSCITRDQMYMAKRYYQIFFNLLIRDTSPFDMVSFLVIEKSFDVFWAYKYGKMES